MIRVAAYIFGIFFLAVGIVGFIPMLAPNNMLLGYFRVNAVHNLAHLITGIIALIVGSTSVFASRLFFRIFGIIYLILAIFGFFACNNTVFWIIANNMADAAFHFVVAIISLYVGFCFAKDEID